MGYIALMQEGLAGPLTETQQESLVQVRQASERLLELIDNLLELTTIKRGGLEVGVDEFDPREALREAVETTTGRPQEVAVRIVVPQDAPRIRSDRTKVVKVLTSLLSNAYKFTPSGEVRARLETTDVGIVYSVEDTGIGIPEAAHEYVFEEFRQVDGSTTRAYGGSGLGLALARGLARRLGGDITLASQPGVGSTFSVALPLDVGSGDGRRRGALARESLDSGA
jgi:signal transduction histidine kinase